MLQGFLILICFLASNLASASTYNSIDLSNLEAREILCSILTNLQVTNGKGVWPGYNPLESPLIVKFNDTVVGYGAASLFIGWKTETVPGCVSYSAPNDFVIPNSPIVPYLDFNGAKAFFFDVTIKPKISSWLLSAIIHERFHRFQWEHFSNIFPLLGSVYTGHSSSEIVAESLLENHKLTSYLISNDDNAWIDFLSLSVLRESSLSEDSKNWELGQQIVEGTATFVQLKSFEVIEKKFNLKFSETWKKKLISNLGDAEGVDGVIKWRHYSLGGLICSFLDKSYSDEGWKLAIQTEKKTTSFFRNVLPFVGVSETTLKARGLAISGSSEGAQARLVAAGMINDYLSEIKRVKDEIVSNVLQVTVNRPNRQCSGGGASEKTYYLPEGGTIGTKYSGSLQCGTDYQETFTDIQVLQESKTSAYFGLNQLKIWIDSSELGQIQDGSYSFANLKIEGAPFALQSLLPGTLFVSGSQIVISFTN